MGTERQRIESAGLVAGVAAALCVVAFTTHGGQNVATSGVALAIVVIAAAALFGRAAVRGNFPHPYSGLTTVLLFTAFATWAALSVGWSILPNASYVGAGRLMAYVSVFAVLTLAAQVFRGRHRELALAVLAAALAISIVALASRVVPSWYSSTDDFARLRAPFDYWNAVGVVAAVGLLPALWLGTTRAVAPGWVAAAYPAGALLIVTLMACQGRGAIVAAALGIAIWLVLGSRRLRGAAFLAVTGALAGLACIWVFSQTALTHDHVAMGLRKHTGLQFGLILLLLIVVAYCAGFAVEHLRERHGLSAARRRQADTVLLVALALSPLVVFAGLTQTERGAWGTVSHGVSDLFNANKAAPGNTPSRLTATSSLRARYWRDAFRVWGDHKFKGTGADTFGVSRQPYRKDLINVQHAHGFIPQTMADLGIVGLVLGLATLIAWLIAAGRALGVRRSAPTRWLRDDDTASALGSLVAATFVFGFHSAIDWTWFVPGAAMFGLVTAGWIAGSARPAPAGVRAGVGTLAQPPWQRALLGVAVALIGIAIAISIYRPARSEHRVNVGLTEVAGGHPVRALDNANDAIDLDNLNEDAYFLKATAQSHLQMLLRGERTLESIAAQQPANPDTWLRLADYRLNTLDRPATAIQALKPLLYLQPNSPQGAALFTAATQALAQQRYRAAIKAARVKFRAELRKIKRRTAAGATTGATGKP